MIEADFNPGKAPQPLYPVSWTTLTRETIASHVGYSAEQKNFMEPQSAS